MLAMALLVLVAGCGDDSDAGAEGPVTVDTGSLSKAQFVERADEICKEGRSEFERRFAAFGRSSTSAAADALTQATEVVETIFIPTYEDLVAEIGALGAPEGDEEQVEAFLNAIQQSIDKAAREPLQVFRTNEPFPEAKQLASEYGLTGCAESLG